MDPLRYEGHVVIIASPFFGHIIPMLDFAKRLSEYHHVTYVASESKVDIIKRRGLLCQSASCNPIQMIGLIDHNDEEIEFSNSSTTSVVESSIDRMDKPLEELLSSGSIDRPIDMIISDVLVHVSVVKASQRQIPVHLFVPNSLMFVMRYSIIAMGNTTNSIVSQKFAQQVIEGISSSKGLICNSIYRMDEQLLNQLHQESFLASNLPIRFVAPLMSQLDEHLNVSDSHRLNTIIDVSSQIEAIEQWLKEKSNGCPSIIYIAFGSMAHLEAKQLIEIAHALNDYTVIWSLKANLRAHLPSLFLDDSKHLVLDWTPQRYILSHPAVCLFISHGGWNSLLESMSAGKVTLVWPLFADQIANGYRLEHELKMGRCIQNLKIENQTRVLLRDELREYLKEILDQEKKYSDKAKEAQRMIIDAQENSSRQSFQEIVQLIRNRPSN